MATEFEYIGNRTFLDGHDLVLLEIAFQLKRIADLQKKGG